MSTTTQTFLGEIFQDGDDGEIILARKTGKAGFVRVGGFATISEAEQASVGVTDLYLKVNRMSLASIQSRNRYGIGGKDDLTVIRCIGIDADTASKNKKYPPRDVVLDRVKMLMRNDPSMIISSDGTVDGGLHLYYLLDQPFAVDNAVWERSVQYVNAIAAQLREELQECLPEYVVDHCENVERLFRAAGALRADGKRADILELNGLRYSLDDLIRYPIEQGDDLHIERTSADSPIVDYLDSIGISTIEDYLRYRLKWEQVDDTHWIRPDSTSGMPTGVTHQGSNGEWGFTCRSSSAGLEQMTWYSLPHIFVACEFGGDWRLAGSFARQSLGVVARAASAVFDRCYLDSDKYQLNDRAAAIWCFENIKDLLYLHDRKEWRAWDGSAWVLAGEKVFEMVSQQMLATAVDFKHYSNVVDPQVKAKLCNKWKDFYLGYLNNREFTGLEKTLRSTLYAASWQFDEEPETIHTPSFRVNLRTGEKTTASVEFKNTVVAKVDPGDAQCPRWLKFLDEIFQGDQEVISYIKRICGYCLTGNVEEQVMFILHGDGNNGKSVFTQTIEYIMGGYATQIDQSAITGTFDSHPTAVASLHRCRLALSSETDQGVVLKEHIVKRITGIDRLVARKMREDFWEFTPTHKLVLSTNNMPIIKGSDEGIWRRIRIVKFDKYFSSPDRTLSRKLKLESPGILAWMIEGAREYLEQGLQTPNGVDSEVASFRTEMDVIGNWLREQCELADNWTMTGVSFIRDGVSISAADFCTPASLLYDDYKLYCARNTLPYGSSTFFGMKIKGKNFKRQRFGPKRILCYLGIILKTQF